MRHTAHHFHKTRKVSKQKKIQEFPVETQEFLPNEWNKLLKNKPPIHIAEKWWQLKI